MLLGCAAKPPELSGALHPDQLPVYPQAQLDASQGLAGADMSGDEGAFYAKYWDLKTSDAPDKVIAWYKTKMPGAREDSTPNLGLTTLTLSTFPGAEKGEYVAVTVNKEGIIHLSECLKAGKHKRD